MIDYEQLVAFVKEKQTNHPFASYDHVERVHNLCLVLAKGQDIDMDILRVAAYVHDIAVPVLGPAGHHDRAAEVAGDLLDRIGLPKEKHPLVYDVIRMHTRYSKTEPKALEAIILKDADGLDYIGAVGIMRSVLRCQQRKLYDGNVSRQGNVVLDDLIKTVTGTFVTPLARQMAEERMEVVRQFKRQLEKEISG